MRFPPFSVLLRGTLCRFSQISSEKFWWFPKLYVILPTCRIRGNAEERPPNVTHRQRHEVELSYTDFLHLFFVFVFYLNSHSRLNDKHFDKKDRFADIGKSAHNERFVFLWDNSPPFARNPHTSILCITQKTIKNESTTTKEKIKRANRLRGITDKLHGISGVRSQRFFLRFAGMLGRSSRMAYQGRCAQAACKGLGFSHSTPTMHIPLSRFSD